jgi:hypothetical protein
MCECGPVASAANTTVNTVSSNAHVSPRPSISTIARKSTYAPHLDRRHRDRARRSAAEGIIRRGRIYAGD